MTINVEIRPNGELIRSDYAIATGSSSEIYLAVNDKSNWWSFDEVYARFQYDESVVYNVKLDSDMNCTVPSDVVGAPFFYVSLMGKSSNGRRAATNQVKIPCDIQNTLI